MVPKSKRIAIIPARGGSKRIPGKNIIEFAGKPMIAWTISAALKSKKFSRVLVSTDCQNIAKISKKYGAEVPFFRKLFCDDITPVSTATLHALEQAEVFWGEKFSEVVQLMPNCPLRTGEDIVSALSNFSHNRREFQISCFKFGWMNPWWSFQLNNDGEANPMFPGAVSRRSQDLEDLFCPTGAIWIANVEKLKEHKTFYASGHAFETIDWKGAVDIDDYDDLEFALAVHALRK